MLETTSSYKEFRKLGIDKLLYFFEDFERESDLLLADFFFLDLLDLLVFVFFDNADFDFFGFSDFDGLFLSFAFDFFGV